MKVSLREFLRELFDFCGAMILLLAVLLLFDIGLICYWELIEK